VSNFGVWDSKSFCMLLLRRKTPQIWYQNVGFGEFYPNKYRFDWYANQSPTLTQDWNPVNQSFPWFTESCSSAFSAKSFHYWVIWSGEQILKGYDKSHVVQIYKAYAPLSVNDSQRTYISLCSIVGHASPVIFSTDMYSENSVKSVERIRRGCREMLIVEK